jgi:hypothetical protein
MYFNSCYIAQELTPGVSKFTQLLSGGGKEPRLTTVTQLPKELQNRGMCWFMPVIPVTPKVEIPRIMVWGLAKN